MCKEGGETIGQRMEKERKTTRKELNLPLNRQDKIRTTFKIGQADLTSIVDNNWTKRVLGVIDHHGDHNFS